MNTCKKLILEELKKEPMSAYDLSKNIPKYTYQNIHKYARELFFEKIIIIQKNNEENKGCIPKIIYKINEKKEVQI